MWLRKTRERIRANREAALQRGLEHDKIAESILRKIEGRFDFKKFEKSNGDITYGDVTLVRQNDGYGNEWYLLYVGHDKIDPKRNQLIYEIKDLLLNQGVRSFSERVKSKIGAL